MTAAAKRALKLVGLVNSELTDDFDCRLGASTAIGANDVRSKTETSWFFLKGGCGLHRTRSSMQTKIRSEAELAGARKYSTQ